MQSASRRLVLRVPRSCSHAPPLAQKSRTGSLRHYMDVHQRPSHSGMFPKKATTSPSSQSPQSQSSLPPEPPYSEWQLYQLLATRATSAVALIYCFTEYVGDVTLCEGPSMSPTIRPAAEIILMDKLTLRWTGMKDGCSGEARALAAQKRQQVWEAQHGDDTWHEPHLSVTDLEQQQGVTWRQALSQWGSPLSVGDVVVVEHPARKGTVCKRVLGLPGDQVVLRRTGELLVVNDGHVWLEGDNPANSSDSRNYGAVPAALIVGRVVARVWPLRGRAWMTRGGRPHHAMHAAMHGTGSTVLPAGYQGQQIIKHPEQVKAAAAARAKR